LRYINHRYQGKICNGALAHWKKHGWHWCQGTGKVAAQLDGVRSEKLYWSVMDVARCVAKPKARCTLIMWYLRGWTGAMNYGIWGNCVKSAIWSKVVVFLKRTRHPRLSMVSLYPKTSR
jgi:hypothetical protein